MPEWQHDGLDTGEERQAIGGGDKTRSTARLSENAARKKKNQAAKE